MATDKQVRARLKEVNGDSVTVALVQPEGQDTVCLTPTELQSDCPIRSPTFASTVPITLFEKDDKGISALSY